MFESLGDRLQNAVDKIRGYGKITDDNVSDVVREIRLALLEADVNYIVVKEFIAKVNGYNHSTADYLLRTDLMSNIVFGFDNENKLVYTAFAKGEGGVTIYWWQIALGLFVILTIIIISVKVTKNKKATAKRVVSKSRQVSKLYGKK